MEYNRTRIIIWSGIIANTIAIIYSWIIGNLLFLPIFAVALYSCFKGLESAFAAKEMSTIADGLYSFCEQMSCVCIDLNETTFPNEWDRLKTIIFDDTEERDETDLLNPSENIHF